MALATSLVPDGRHHAHSTGSIDIGGGFGQVAGTGANQLLRVLLPFDVSLYANDEAGFAAQLYVIASILDSNITAVAKDATDVEFTTSGAVLRLRVDVVAVPAALGLHIDAAPSAVR
jgi:hypothetical protein